VDAPEASRSSGNGRAIGAVALGLLSAATMPVAIVATRYSESYELLHAGFAIPVGVALGILAIWLGRGALRHDDARLGRAGGRGAARLGRALGVALPFRGLQQPRPEDLQRPGPVLQLAALVLHRHDDAGREVGEPDRRVRGVDRLATGAGRAVDVDLEVVGIDLDVDVLEAAFARLSDGDEWPVASYDGSRRHLANLKNLTSALINRFCLRVREAARRADLPQPLVRYAADLPVPLEVRAEIAVLKGVAAHIVMKSDDRVTLLARQRGLLGELVEAMAKQAPESLDPAFRADFAAAADEAARLRVVVDQVASLTDPSAVGRHEMLTSSAG